MNRVAVSTLVGMLIASAFLSVAMAQEADDNDVRPSPPSIGSDIP